MNEIQSAIFKMEQYAGLPCEVTVRYTGSGVKDYKVVCWTEPNACQVGLSDTLDSACADCLSRIPSKESRRADLLRKLEALNK